VCSSDLAFGWHITTAALTDTVQRCEFSRSHGLPPIVVDSLVSEIKNIAAFDIVCLLPNTTGMDAIRQDSLSLSLLREAADSGLVIAAWCKSVRVLAAAGLLTGLSVVGHAEFRSEYEAAGATYVGNDHPPITVDRIITAVRSRFYRVEACQAMQSAVDAARR
jgi:putative intracellular protease/amidase